MLLQCYSVSCVGSFPWLPCGRHFLSSPPGAAPSVQKDIFYWKSIPIIFVAMLRRFYMQCYYSCDLRYVAGFLNILICFWCPYNYKKIPKDPAYIIYIFVELSSPIHLPLAWRKFCRFVFLYQLGRKRRFCSKNKTCCQRTCKMYGYICRSKKFPPVTLLVTTLPSSCLLLHDSSFYLSLCYWSPLVRGQSICTMYTCGIHLLKVDGNEKWEGSGWR